MKVVSETSKWNYVDKKNDRNGKLHYATEKWTLH